MKIKQWPVLVGCILGFSFSAALAAHHGHSMSAANSGGLSSFTPAQQQQLKQYMDSAMQQYIMKNPKVVIESVKQLEKQQQQAAMQAGMQVIVDNINQLVHNPASPSIGPANAPVTIVEFYDYQCSVCHAMYPRVKQLLKQNPNVRYVAKEFPIFGPASQFAAKASMAAAKQGKFEALHNALFASSKMEGKLTNQDVLDMASKAGINMAKLKKDMQDPAIAKEIKDNYALAGKLKLQGTPAFIIVPTPAGKQLSKSALASKLGFVPGAADVAQLQALINQAK